MQTLTFINAIIVFALAFAVSSICVPLVIKLAIKKRLFSENGGRHVHTGYVPKLGGFAIFAGFFFSQIYFIIAHQETEYLSESYFLLLFSSTLLFLLGILDDLVDINAYLKFIIQITSRVLIFF